MSDGMMEVSFENLNVSAMSVDEGSNSHLMESDNNNRQQSSLRDSTDGGVSGQQRTENINLSDQENGNIRYVTEFPKRTEDIAEAVDAPRFPLGDTNDQNLSNSTVSSLDRVKLHMFDSPKKDAHTSGKENQGVDASIEISEFPLLSNRGLDDKFPLEPSKTINIGSCPLVEEEKFTSGNQYNFSAIDFDCLLSRGSSQDTATKSASDASIALPRNSVLINFDPLLRRQTIVKADTIAPNDFEPSGDRCVNLLGFPTKQENCDSQSKSGYPTPSESGVFSKPNEPDLHRCIAIDESGESPVTNYSEREGFPTQEKEEKLLPLQLLDELLFKSASGVEEQGTNETPFINSNEISVFSTLPEQVNEHRLSPTIDTLNQDILAETHQNQGEEPLQNVDNLNRNNNTNVLELLKLDVLTDSEEASCELEKQADFSNYTTNPKEDNELMQMNNMLDISIPEKQHNFLNNMSDDHTAHQDQDASNEVEKKCKTDENNFSDMEKKMQAVDLREESMLKRITEKDKTICKMSNVVEAYERTIAELISEKETLIRTHELECESLKQDNEINAQHLESLEKTFSNLYAKYERMKKNAVEYKEREENLMNKVLKLEECLRVQEQRYEKMKSHAISQLEMANTKIDEANRNHSQESAKLKAQIKKEELYRISINEQLIQKSKENEELVKICDELISDTN